MKVIFTGILVTSLSVLPVSSSIAEDDSCELKDDSQITLADGQKNEFTRDKTWHFKADNILQKENHIENDMPSEISTSKTAKGAVKF